MIMRVDLHMHSTASDGVYSPADVVQIALVHQMDVIALTDHDSVSGVLDAQNAAAASGRLEVIPGIELCTENAQHTEWHLLGYLFDPQDRPPRGMLAELQNARTTRAAQMVQKLADLGIKIPLERVYAVAGTGSVTRPHVAQVLIENGYATSIQDAFEKYIGSAGPAYVLHYQLEPARAIDLIHRAGGVAVLAHPGHYENCRAVIENMVPVGLDGLEVYYFDHTPAMVEEFEFLARRHHLVSTVGSDFHRREADGSARIGSVKTPPHVHVMESLRERAARYRA